MAYPIKKDYITVENRPGTFLAPQGGALHSTATPGATDEREQDYFEDEYRAASANTFIDWDSITEIIPLNERSWHAGATANRKFFSVEMCEPANYDMNKFMEVWNRTVWYFAYQFVSLGIKTVTKSNLMSHAEISAAWHETDHQDPVAYLAQYGKTVDGFRSAVQNEINTLLGGGWKQINGVWYYFENGVSVKNKWVKDSVDWCYLGSDGAAIKNKWQQDTKGWCYIGDNYRIIRNAWAQDTIGWCYVKPDGYWDGVHHENKGGI